MRDGGKMLCSQGCKHSTWQSLPTLRQLSMTCMKEETMILEHLKVFNNQQALSNWCEAEKRKGAYTHFSSIDI